MKLFEKYGLWGAALLVFVFLYIAFWLVTLVLALAFSIFIPNGVMALVAFGGMILISVAMGLSSIQVEKAIHEARIRSEREKKEGK